MKRGKPGARKDAQRLFGRNVITEALGVKSAAMVSYSPVWQAIADDLGLRRTKKDKSHRGQRIGMEIALEEQAVATSHSAADEASWRETIQLIEAAMPQTEAEATIEKLHRGEMTDDQAREVIRAYAEQELDDRSHKRRQAP